MSGKYLVKETKILGKALLLTNENELIYYRKGNLYIYDLEKRQKNKKIVLPIRCWKKMCSKIRLLERLLHMEARWAIQIEKDHILFQFDHKIFLIDIKNSKISIENIPVQGNPLSIESIKDNPGFSDSLVVGDYTSNKQRKEVSLYGRDDYGNWHKVYQFASGTVRHIHGCVSNVRRQCVYVLTGDANGESGIWKATENFKKVEPFLVGKQQYRACQMLIGNDVLYYFTDAPSEPNYAYEVKENTVRKLQELCGTCIYGTRFGEEGVYSTTCEPEANAENRVSYWLSNVPGSGIIGKNVTVFVVTSDGAIHILCRFEHDGLPLRLFQYGTVTFTNAIGNHCYFTPICVKGKDMHIYEVVKNIDSEGDETKE